jgi:glycosyltransferase involved in cell wall biosynthesis
MDSVKFRSTGDLGTDKPAILALGWNKWSDFWMPRQQYLFRLAARGWPVVYSAGNRHVRDTIPALRNGKARLRSHFRTDSNVKVYEPSVLYPRWPKLPLYDRFAIWNEVRQLKQAIPDDGRAVVAFITHPIFAQYLDALGDMPVAYFAEDAFSLIPGWDEMDQAEEKKLVDRANLIVTCAASMAKELPGDGPGRANIIRNGVDYTAYNMPSAKICPEDLAAIPEPRIGYTGSINLKVDFNLIAASAKRRPDWNWVLIGPAILPSNDNATFHAEVAANYARCRELPNVHFLGSKPFYDLPSYMANMTVNTMCYRTDGSGWWKAIDPLKTNEYLAAGRPVVSADLVNVRPYSDCIDIASSEDEWDTAIEKAIVADTTKRIEIGKFKAKQNDWNILTDEFEDHLLSLAHR